MTFKISVKNVKLSITTFVNKTCDSIDDTQHNDTQHNNAQHNDTQHNDEKCET